MTVKIMNADENSIRQLTLREYVRQRNGVPLGGRGSMSNMLSRSFGAKSLAAFWRYWNPIFGFYLHRFVFAPVSHITPRWLALVVTFLVCGALHDAVTFVARGSTTFLFTTMFACFAIGVLASEAVRLDMSKMPWLVRALINLIYIVACITAAFYARSVIPSWPTISSN